MCCGLTFCGHLRSCWQFWHAPLWHLLV